MKSFSRRLKLTLGCFAVLILTGIAAYVWRDPLLIGAANLWIVDEPATSADAVVVLGGGLQYRAFEAVKLFNERKCPKVLVVKVKLEPSDEAGITEPEYLKVKRLLEKKGVPREAIIEIGSACSSTWEDIEAARQWAKGSGATTLLIPTDLFHTRRVRWICRRIFQDSRIRYVVPAVNPPEYCLTNWWQREQGLIGFQNEVVKFGFYMLKYSKRTAETKEPEGSTGSLPVRFGQQR